MSELRDTRLEKAKALKSIGQGPYGLNFRPTDSAVVLQEKYADLPNGEEKKEEVKLVKPEYLEDKFWDPKTGVKTEDLNTSYKELQKAFSMGKHKAPKEYDMSALEDIDEDDELASYFKDWAKENKPTQAAYDNLVN